MAGEEGSSGEDELKRIASKIDAKMLFYKGATLECMEMKRLVGELTEEKARMQQECMEMKRLVEELTEENARIQQEACRSLATAPPDLLAPVLEQLVTAKDELAVTKEELAAAKEEVEDTKQELTETKEELAAAKEAIEDTKQELMVTKEKLVAVAEELTGTNMEGLAAMEELAATKEELEAAKEQLVEKGERLKAVTMKVQEMTRRNQEAQEGASETVLDSVQCQPQMVQHFGQQLPGHSASSDKDLEVLREVLIKEFMQLDCGGRLLGVKEIGRLNRKPLHAACAAKLPPEEVGKAASKLYTAWEKLLKNPSWKPFKTVAVGDDNREDIIDVDDGMLQELKRTWGEGAHDAVVSALMEMREYNHLSDRIITHELWNYKAGRKATVLECVAYLGKQVKQLSVAKRRKTRRTSGIA